MTIVDPLLQTDASLSGLRQAQATELQNARIALESAINDLARIKSNAGRGNRSAAINSYRRAYDRIRQAAGRIFEMISEESEVPAWDPPKPLGEESKTVRLGAPDPFAKAVAPPKPSKPIPGNIKPGTAAWYRCQGHPVPEGCPE